MTTTVTQARQFIEQAFKYYGYIPPLTNYTSVERLRDAYEAQGGETHWFSPETIRYFGSRNMVLHRPGIMIETQTKTPHGVDPICVTAWVDFDGRITPFKMERFANRSQAKAFVEILEDQWPDFA